MLMQPEIFIYLYILVLFPLFFLASSSSSKQGTKSIVDNWWKEMVGGGDLSLFTLTASTANANRK